MQMKACSQGWVTGFLWLSFAPTLVCTLQMWITKDDYDEVGPNIVHRKCM